MATTLVGDPFNVGTGTLAGAAPLYSDAAFGTWTVALDGSWAHSSTGAVYTVSTVSSGLTTVTILGAKAISGLTVYEIAGYGPIGIAARFNSASTQLAQVTVDATGQTSSSFRDSANVTTGGGLTTTGVSRTTSTRTVLRIELDGTSTRTYIDNVLLYTAGVITGSTYSIRFLFSVATSGTTALLSPFSGRLVEYINSATGVAASGPLGSPGGTQGGHLLLGSTLLMTGGQFAKGNVAGLLPLLYLVPAPAVPTFWGRKVGVHESA